MSFALPGEGSKMAQTRSARTRVSRRQCGVEQTCLNNGLAVQVDPERTLGAGL
jgi:hypothetical protein